MRWIDLSGRGNSAKLEPIDGLRVGELLAADYGISKTIDASVDVEKPKLKGVTRGDARRRRDAGEFRTRAGEIFKTGGVGWIDEIGEISLDVDRELILASGQIGSGHRHEDRGARRGGRRVDKLAHIGIDHELAAVIDTEGLYRCGVGYDDIGDRAGGKIVFEGLHVSATSGPNAQPNALIVDSLQDSAPGVSGMMNEAIDAAAVDQTRCQAGYLIEVKPTIVPSFEMPLAFVE